MIAVKKMTTKIKIIIISAVIFVIITSALIINKERMSAKANSTNFSAIPVTVVQMKKQISRENLSFVGSVMPDNEVFVISETQGKVLDINMKIGTFVEKNTVIAYIDDEMRQAAFLTAKTAYEKAKKDLERAGNLYKQQYISDADFENVRLNATNSESQFIIARKQDKRNHK
jgi:membrane fusion protein (multidrug efflux system)